jgi:hypothetical protein
MIVYGTEHPEIKISNQSYNRVEGGQGSEAMLFIENGHYKATFFMSKRIYTMLNRNQLGKFILRVDSCCVLGA